MIEVAIYRSSKRDVRRLTPAPPAWRYAYEALPGCDGPTWAVGDAEPAPMRLGAPDGWSLVGAGVDRRLVSPWGSPYAAAQVVAMWRPLGLALVAGFPAPDELHAAPATG